LAYRVWLQHRPRQVKAFNFLSYTVGTVGWATETAPNLEKTRYRSSEELIFGDWGLPEAKEPEVILKNGPSKQRPSVITECF